MDRDGLLEDFMKNRGAKAFNQDTLDKELLETIGTGPENGVNVIEDDPYIALSRVREVILDGADMYAQLHFGKFVPYSSFDSIGKTMDPTNIMTYSIFKAKLRPSVYLPWIKELLELGYDVNRLEVRHNTLPKHAHTPLMNAMTTCLTDPFIVDLDVVLNPPDRQDPTPHGFYATERG